MPLADNDVKSELSYAYLHAVAARAGCECHVAQRHSDGMGVDARLFVEEVFAPPSPLRRFTVELQLKATSTPLNLNRGRYAFRLPIDQYDKLRTTDTESPQLLLVLQLPPQPADWLKCSPRALTLKGCAYWASLYDAPASPNEAYQTVYLPKGNRFSVEARRSLLPRFSRRERIVYVSQ
jgi:hypothetical protein